MKETYVPKYLVLYRASNTAIEQMANTPPEQAQAGMELWMQWAGKAGDRIVDLGQPLASVADLGVSNRDNLSIAGFSILEGSRDEITSLLEDHPHFHTPGDSSIEVLEFQPIPGA
jgi:hypothetical protein